MHSQNINLSSSDSTLFLIDKTNTGLKDLNCGILKFMQLSCHFAQERTISKTSLMELPCYFAQKRTFSKTKYMELPCHFVQERTFFKTKYMEFPCHFAQKRTLLKSLDGTCLPLCTKNHLYFDLIHQPENSGETLLDIKFTKH